MFKSTSGINAANLRPAEQHIPATSLHVHPVSGNKTSKQYKILFISSLCVMIAGQGLKKNLNFSLSFGQAFITFFLPWAPSCSYKLMILLED